MLSLKYLLKAAEITVQDPMIRVLQHRDIGTTPWMFRASVASPWCHAPRGYREVAILSCAIHWSVVCFCPWAGPQIFFQLTDLTSSHPPLDTKNSPHLYDPNRLWENMSSSPKGIVPHEMVENMFFTTHGGAENHGESLSWLMASLSLIWYLW